MAKSMRCQARRDAGRRHAVSVTTDRIPGSHFRRPRVERQFALPRGSAPTAKCHDRKQDDRHQDEGLQNCEIGDAGDFVTDRVAAAVRDGGQSFNKLSDRQRKCRPLSELGRAIRSSVASEPPSGETDDRTKDHVEDRVPSSDIHTERRSDSGS